MSQSSGSWIRSESQSLYGGDFVGGAVPDEQFASDECSGVGQFNEHHRLGQCHSRRAVGSDRNRRVYMAVISSVALSQMNNLPATNVVESGSSTNITDLGNVTVVGQLDPIGIAEFIWR